jgi:hypothetical protein
MEQIALSSDAACAAALKELNSAKGRYAAVKSEAEYEAEVAKGDADAQAKRDADREKSKELEAKISTGPTLANFVAVKMGMSYPEVKDAVGYDGDEVSQVEIGGIRDTMFQWTGRWGNNMIVTFENGTVTSKAQFGLK